LVLLARPTLAALETFSRALFARPTLAALEVQAQLVPNIRKRLDFMVLTGM
jgi:hypothetical protein